jgi:Uma2 family endonuclease
VGAEKILFSTVEDWLATDDSERMELIEGELVQRVMPSADHSYTASQLAGLLHPFNNKGGGGGGSPGGWWIYAEASVVYPNRPNGFVHDLAGWRRDKHKERPHGKRILETPDWVCEILSENRGSDLIRKKRVLHQNRVSHYWTVDHRDKILTVMRWVEGGYLNVQEISPDEVKGEKTILEPFDGLAISVEEIFGIET